MKKVLNKVLLCSILAVCLSTLLSTAAFAAGDDFAPSDVFIDVCDHLFTEGSGYMAIDKNGVDVTSQFVRDYREEYLAGNYETIFEAVIDDLKTITWKESEPQETVVINGKVSQHFYETGRVNDHVPSTTFEVGYKITGYFDYYDGTGQIYDNRNLRAYLEIEHIGIGAQYNAALHSSSTSAEVSQDQRSATFTAEFDVAVSLVSGPGFYVWTEYVGPFGDSVTGISY